MFVINYHLPTIIMLVVATAYAGKFSDYNVLGPNKGPKCYQPTIGYDCRSSIYDINDYKLVGWFYHLLFKSCRPFYSENGTHVCPQNQKLPLTKEECEEECGEPCKTGFGTDGICMLEEYCHPKEPASANPRPCGAYNVKCCPRSVPSTTPEPKLEKIPSKASHIQSNMFGNKKYRQVFTELRKASENE